MSTESTAGRTTRFSRFTRLSLLVQVAVAIVLAIVLAVLAIVVAERPELRLRMDATSSGRNSLDDLTVELLEELPEGVRIETFFERVPGILGPAVAEAQQRTAELLRVMSSYVPEKLEVTHHVMTGSERIEATRRMADLGLKTTQKVAVTIGERSAVMALEIDLASFSAGDPNRGVPPEVTRFRGEEAMAEALSRLLTRGTPRVLFATGHEEYAIAPSAETASRRDGRLMQSARLDLEREGFETGLWDPSTTGAVPSDCDLLAIVGPLLPFSERDADWVQEFLDRGGRLLVAVDLGVSGHSGKLDPLGELLARYGIRTARGYVNAPTRGYEGSRECALLQLEPELLSSSHPVTRALRENERRLLIDSARAFTPRGPTPFDGTLLDLFVSPDGSWIDLPSNRLEYDHVYDSRFEERSAFSIGLAADIDLATSERDARIVALGSPSILGDETYAYNRDFVRNAVNWLVDREVRIRLSQRDPFESTIDLARGDEYRKISAFGMAVLPGLCALLGLFTAWRRRRED